MKKLFSIQIKILFLCKEAVVFSRTRSTVRPAISSHQLVGFVKSALLGIRWWKFTLGSSYNAVQFSFVHFSDTTAVILCHGCAFLEEQESKQGYNQARGARSFDSEVMSWPSKFLFQL